MIVDHHRSWNRSRHEPIEFVNDQLPSRVVCGDSERVVGIGRLRVADHEVAVTIVHLALEATAVTGIDVAVDVGYKAS